MQRFWRSTALCLALAGAFNGFSGAVQAQTADPNVLQIELRLKELGYLLSGADGIATQESVDAVVAFQRNHGLTPDGKLGETERTLLFSSAARRVNGTAAAPQATAPQTQAAPAQTPAAPARQVVNTSPHGAWYGELTCQVRRRDTSAETEFTIRTREDGVLGMIMTTATEASMGSGTSEVSYVGEATNGGYRFVVEKMIRAPIYGNNRNTNQEILFDPATGRMTPPEGCAPFVARRQQQPDPRLIITAAAPANGGSYFAASAGRNRCEVLIAWADRANTEFPGRNFYRQNKPGDDWILIKLFADDDFVPVFGQAYDTMPLEARMAVAQDARKCRQDPFTRNRMETYFAAADRVMSGNPERQLTSNGYSSTIFAIRQIRAIRNELRALANGTAQVLPGESFAQTVNRMKGIRARAGKDSGRLWPSETGAIGAGIDQFLDGLATQEAARFLKALASTTEAEKGLSAIATHEKKRTSDTYFARYLSSANSKSLTDQVGALKQKIANARAAPILAKAAKAQQGIAGALELNGLIKDLQKITALPRAERDKLATQLSKARDTRIETYVTSAQAKITDLPATLAGLSAEKEWLADFDRETARLADHPKIKSARSAVIAAREDRLEAALPEFEEKLAAISSGKDADALLESYLSLKGDSALPIALEYQFLVELAK